MSAVDLAGEWIRADADYWERWRSSRIHPAGAPMVDCRPLPRPSGSGQVTIPEPGVAEPAYLVLARAAVAAQKVGWLSAPRSVQERHAFWASARLSAIAVHATPDPLLRYYARKGLLMEVRDVVDPAEWLRRRDEKAGRA